MNTIQNFEMDNRYRLNTLNQRGKVDSSFEELLSDNNSECYLHFNLEKELGKVVRYWKKEMKIVSCRTGSLIPSSVTFCTSSHI